MFPAVIDNTIRKAMVACPTQVMYRHVQNIRPKEEKLIDLHYGKCFATGIEFARKNFFIGFMSAVEAVDSGVAMAIKEWGEFNEPTKSNKSLGTLVSALHYYFGQWPLGEDGLTPTEGGIECRFAIEIPVWNPDTGTKLMYAGRYDMRALDDAGRTVIVDEKTTSRLGDSWWQQWDLDSQMTGYIWSVLQEDPEADVSAMIRGISVLRDGHGHVEVPIQRTKFMVDRWYWQMLRDVQRMVESYQQGRWDQALSGACVGYGRPCDYAKLCLRPNPEQIIESEYKVVVWNPLN